MSYICVSQNTYTGSYKTFIERHLIPFFGSMEISDIKPFDIQRLFAEKSELSESTLDKFHMMLRGIFLTAVDNGYCSRSPMTFIVYRSKQKKERKRVYSHDDMIQVKEYFKQSLPAISFLLETGLRRGELLGLKWSDVDFAHSTISVNRSVSIKKGGGVELRPPKWNSYRVIPVANSGMTLLKTVHDDEAGSGILPCLKHCPILPNMFFPIDTVGRSIPVLSAMCLHVICGV